MNTTNPKRGQRLYAMHGQRDGTGREERLWNETATSEDEAVALSQGRIDAHWPPKNHVTVTRAERVYDLLFRPDDAEPPRRRRTFDFEAGQSHRDCVLSIGQALIDEGLRLIDDVNTDRITSVRMTDGGRLVDRYIVPAWRIAGEG